MKKIKVLTKTIIGPGDKLSLDARSNPPRALINPKNEAKIVYVFIRLVKFFEAAAGMITNAPIRSIPTTFMPRATTMAIVKRKINSVLETLIP